MAILNNNPLIGSGGNQGYNINNSLRFRSSASARLSRTFSSTGTNNKIQTFSAWVKRGLLSSSAGYRLMGGYNGSANYSTEINFINDNLRVEFGGSVQYELKTTQVFRDPSAWYHIVVAIDTTQATSSNRVKMYVNGSQITAFATANYPAQNDSSQLTSANANNNIGASWSAAEPFDGYMAEVNFIDGSAKTPSDFGETDTTTGVWKPKAYTGTYGTNGFYLKFSDIATTSGSNAGLGKDFSGNTNYWTTNNISVTSDTTYDAMTDSPTNTSATVANYCVLNPLQVASATLSNANLSMARSGTGYGESSSTFSPEGNKGYFEITRSSTGDHLAGFILNSISPSTNNYTASGSYWYQCDTGSVKYGTGGSTATLITGCTSAPTGSQIIMVAFDFTGGNRNVWFGLQGTWGVNASSQTGVPSTGAFPHLTTTQLTDVCRLYFSSGDANTFSINFGQRPFSYTPPTGYLALNTFNLPNPTILQGNKYMDATLYTGTGATQSITNAGLFKPDLVWVKARNAAQWHLLFDSVRGVGNWLTSNNTTAEVTDATSLTAFNSNGFAVSTDPAVSADTGWNASGNTMVGWQWQAGQGSTSSNTSGSITSTVSVNTTAGFSIVTYTGNGTSGATIGHGLGVAPKMIILKSRSGGTYNWRVYHSNLTSGYSLAINSTAAETQFATNAGYISAVSSTTFTLTQSGANTLEAVNKNGDNYVAYCWAEIAGFSKFGSYTGNGSTDGTFVYTGFRPKYILIKRTNLTEDWYIYDTSRITYNLGNIFIYADLSDAEGTGSTGIDILSNGFKQRQTGGGNNASGSTYIYMAFAENPFKNALAR